MATDTVSTAHLAPPLERWEHFGRTFLCARHTLPESGLFTDERIADLIDRYPRHLLQCFAMGEDPSASKHDWHPVDTAGVSGAAAVSAVKRGRLWFKLLQMQHAPAPYGDLVASLYAELIRACPGFDPVTRSGILLLGSPHSQVYFHVDAKPNMLWHIRGHKRFWLYPPYDWRLVPQATLEDIYMNVQDEEVPYSPSFDDDATIFDLSPGDVLSWPQNAPHRVAVLDEMSVSLSTFHVTPASERREQIFGANWCLRRLLSVNRPSIAEHGPIPYAKAQAFRVARRLRLARPAARRPYRTALVVDPTGPGGHRRRDDGPVLTEFARGPGG